MAGRRITIETPKGSVSAVVTGAGAPVLALAHGAGGSIDEVFLAAFCESIARKGITCLRFNFPYRESNRRSPDPEPVLRATWLAVLDEAAKLGKPVGGPVGSSVWVGGKSMGGRIASMVVADGAAAAGLVFLGYPLHPPGRPERLRDAHLYRIDRPMLFIQGTRDSFADPRLLAGVLRRLGRRAVLHQVTGGDHSFRVRGQKKDDAGPSDGLAAVAAEFILKGPP